MKFFLEFSKNFDIYFLKSMSGNIGIHTVSQENTFWSICISAQISFLKFYGVTSTDKSKFQPNYSIPYAIRFQKMWILWVVQFITEKPLPNHLWAVLVRIPFHRNTKARLKLASLSNFKNFFQYGIVMGNQFAGCFFLK